MDPGETLFALPTALEEAGRNEPGSVSIRTRTQKVPGNRLYGVVRHLKERWSDLLHFNGAWTFLSFADFKGDFVAFVQGITLGLGMMNEKVFCSIIRLDESESLFTVKPLNCSLRHLVCILVCYCCFVCFDSTFTC